jgi:hypothetical protein
MNWLYQSKEFTDQHIPEGAVGFVYMMTAIIDGKCLRYIGKKNFYSVTKKRMGKRALAAVTDQRLKKYTKETKLNYKHYYSSNNVLQAAHKRNTVIHREILKICYSTTELTYEETKYLFQYEVLEKDDFLNGNILGRFYKQKK